MRVTRDGLGCVVVAIVLDAVNKTGVIITMRIDKPRRGNGVYIAMLQLTQDACLLKLIVLIQRKEA